MDTIQAILLKKTQRDFSRPNQNSSPKKRRKRRSESLETIFRLPKSILDKFRSQRDGPPLKRERSHIQQMEQAIQLGSFGQDYHRNLRRTMLGQTKHNSSALKDHKSTLHHNNFLFQDSENNLGSTMTYREEVSHHYQKNLCILKILKKVATKEDDFFGIHENMMEVHANRLPIIKKKQSKRKKLLAAFQQRHFQNSPGKRQQPRQRQYRLQKRDFIPFPNNKKSREQKLDIRGWDTPQPPEL